MKTILRKKLSEHNGRLYCELRDYEIKGQSKIRVIYGDEQMFLTKSQLDKGVIVNTQKSQFPPYAYYKMIEFLWKPKIEEKEIIVPSPLEAMSEYASGDKWEELRAKLHR